MANSVLPARAGEIFRMGFDILTVTYVNTFLLPAVFAFRALRRLPPKSGASDFVENLRSLNSPLPDVFSLEASLVRCKRVAAGISALCLPCKPRRTGD